MKNIIYKIRNLLCFRFKWKEVAFKSTNNQDVLLQDIFNTWDSFCNDPVDNLNPTLTVSELGERMKKYYDLYQDMKSNPLLKKVFEDYVEYNSMGLTVPELAKRMERHRVSFYGHEREKPHVFASDVY